MWSACWFRHVYNKDDEVECIFKSNKILFIPNFRHELASSSGFTNRLMTVDKIRLSLLLT